MFGGQIRPEQVADELQVSAEEALAAITQPAGGDHTKATKLRTRQVWAQAGTRSQVD
jgi:hypothetical protein